MKAVLIRQCSKSDMHRTEEVAKLVTQLPNYTIESLTITWLLY
jgi:hypothetical protein